MSEITKAARKLRKNQTEAEIFLWQKLRYNKLGVKFRRQFPIIFISDNRKLFFIADFVCIEMKLIIEVDGGIHEKLMDKDEERTSVLDSLGYIVIRFTNEEVFSDVESVIQRIMRFLFLPIRPLGTFPM